LVTELVLLWVTLEVLLFAAADAPVVASAVLSAVFDGEPSVSWFVWIVALPTLFPPLFELALWWVLTSADWSTSLAAPLGSLGKGKKLWTEASSVPPLFITVEEFVWLTVDDDAFTAADDPVVNVAEPVSSLLGPPRPMVLEFRWNVKLPTSFPPLFEWACCRVRTCADWSTFDDAAGSEWPGEPKAVALRASVSAPAAPAAMRVLRGLFKAVPPEVWGTACVYSECTIEQKDDIPRVSRQFLVRTCPRVESPRRAQ
jgi:hypothetical protein